MKSEKGIHNGLQPYRQIGMVILDDSAKPWIMFNNNVFFMSKANVLKMCAFYNMTTLK